MPRPYNQPAQPFPPFPQGCTAETAVPRLLALPRVSGTGVSPVESILRAPRSGASRLEADERLRLGDGEGALGGFQVAAAEGLAEGVR